MLDFYNNKGSDMLKLESTLPNLECNCLHKSTTAIFYPFTESDKDFRKKIREHMVAGQFMLFNRKTVEDKTSVRDSTNWFKLIVENDASQL